MAVSNSTDYSETTDSIILDAYQDLGVLDTNQSPSQSQIQSAKRRLNRLLKSWQAEGVGLWLKQEITLALEYGATYYDLGLTGDHASAAMIKTEVATAASSTDTTIEVDSISGISNGDYIGIELDDGTLQWTTVNGAPSGSTITLTDALTDDVAIDNHVYAYTTKTFRPIRIVPDSARLMDADDEETTVNIVSQQEYKALADKDTTGSINTVYYDAQLTNGRLYTWPACDDVKTRLVIIIERPIYDMDELTNNYDLPQYWYLALEYNLALILSPMSKTDDSTFARIQGLASYYYNQVKDFDRENVSVFFQPDFA